MMDLQTGLIAAGVICVAAVFGYNKWHEIRARKHVERAFSTEHDDVLMKETPEHTARSEPSLSNAESPDESAQIAEPALIPAPVPKELPIDDLIDCTINLLPEQPVRGDRMLTLIAGMRFIGNKPVNWIGQTSEGHWDLIGSGVSYVSLRVGVQMANRTSALSELEFSEWVSSVRRIGDEVGAEIVVPDMVDVMERARWLYQFTYEHDAQLSVSILSKNAPWALQTLIMSLERQGLSTRPDGRLVRQDEQGNTVFSVNLNTTGVEDSTHRLTLLLNVPLVATERRGFDEMNLCAHALADKLEGQIVDDENRILPDDALAEISQQVDAFHEEMQRATILPGSRCALRLYDR